ncbi:MAG: hypothetical protein ACP5R2_09535, partial [Anaerolineae bacterium]
ADAVARQVERCVRSLEGQDSRVRSGSGPSEHRFFVTAAPDVLQSLLVHFTGREWPVERLAWRTGHLAFASEHSDRGVRSDEGQV